MYKSTTISAQLLEVACDNDLYHAGIKSNVTRTNLAHANESCPSEVFQKFYFHLLDHYKFPCGRGSRKEEKNLKRIDATTISLNLSDYSWAKFRTTKGGIKINARFDCGIDCADWLFITNANKHGQSKKKSAFVTLRQAVSYDNDTKKEIALLINMFEADPLEIAAIYKKRWDVELFFKMIKQNLKVKRFYGQSENAIKTQIWIALIVHLLFLILKAMTGVSKRTFSSFCSETSVVLFKHRNLEKWFVGDHEKSPPRPLPDKNELWLVNQLGLILNIPLTAEPKCFSCYPEK